MRLCERIYMVGSGDAGISLTDSLDCSVYLIENGSECVLIDAGGGVNPGKILDEIVKTGHPVSDVKSILLTHGHGDHAGGAFELSRICGAKVYGMEDTAKFVSQGDLKALSLETAIEAGIYQKGYQFKPCKVTPLKDRQCINAGNLCIKAYLTEGHSAGHACYEVVFGGRKVLFTGDSVFYGGKISLQSTWDCDIQKYIRTIRILAELHPDALLPAHGAFAVKRGYLHIQRAVNTVDSLGIPRNIIGE